MSQLWWSVFPLFKIIIPILNQILFFIFSKIFILFVSILSFFTFPSLERFRYLSRAFFVAFLYFLIIFREILILYTIKIYMNFFFFNFKHYQFDNGQYNQSKLYTKLFFIRNLCSRTIRINFHTIVTISPYLLQCICFLKTLVRNNFYLFLEQN